MISPEAYEFGERCRKNTATKPLLTELLQSPRKPGFEHLILCGVPLGGQKLAPMVEPNGWPQGWSNGVWKLSTLLYTASAFSVSGFLGKLDKYERAKK